MATPVIVDTNVLFAALVHGQSRNREILLTSSTETFYSPRFIFVELFKHKERIQTATELAEFELLECMNSVLARITFLDEGTIPMGTWLEARRLCRDVDPKDTPFIALALHLNGFLWTNDTELKTGLEIRGFTRFFAG